MPASHKDSKDDRRTKIHVGSLENQLARHNTLLSHSLKELIIALTLTKLMLSLRI